MMTCLFCKLVAGELPVSPLIETETILAFADIHPQAPHHYLVIPKTHVDSLATCQDPTLLGSILAGVTTLTQQLGITDFRTVINTGEAAGQTIFHLHAHVLAGRPFSWPPG